MEIPILIPDGNVRKETEKEFEKLKQLSDEFIKQEESKENIEEETVEEDEEIVIEPK